MLGSARATNEENYLAAKLAHEVLHSKHLDSCLRATYTPFRAGIADVTGRRQLPSMLDDLERSDVVLLLEGDLAGTHPHAAFSVMRAVKRGARLITLGPVRTQMSRLAALHIPMVPGTESAVLGGLLAAVVEGGWMETPPGRLAEEYQAVRESVSGLAPSASVRSAAEWYAKAERASILIGTSWVPPDEARQTGRALTTLAAITGHLGRSGSMVMPLPARWNLRGACEMGVLPDGSAWRDQLAFKEASAKQGHTSVDPNPVGPGGMDAERMMSEASALVVLADDPPSVLPMGKAALTAMARMECIVVLDAFATATTDMASVVLPIASFAETDGTSTNLEGRVQRVRACHPPPGEARPGWQVLADLAGSLGGSFSYAAFDQVTQEIARAMPGYAALGSNAPDDPWCVITTSGDGRGLTVQALQPARDSQDDSSPVLTWDGVFDWGQDPLVVFSPVLSRDYNSQRKLCPGGMVEINKQDADALGVRPGWQVRLSSELGEVVLPVSLREDLERGVLLVPYALRDQAAAVLGRHRITHVRVERA